MTFQQSNFVEFMVVKILSYFIDNVLGALSIIDYFRIFKLVEIGC